MKHGDKSVQICHLSFQICCWWLRISEVRGWMWMWTHRLKATVSSHHPSTQWML